MQEKYLEKLFQQDLTSYSAIPFWSWNNELDELGMDTISAASTLAYAMEANEKGLWDNGLHFGDTEGISSVWDDIAHRRGIGAELADGSQE